MILAPWRIDEQRLLERRLAVPQLGLACLRLGSVGESISLEPADRPERRNQQPQKEEEQRDHRGRLYVIPLPDQTDEVFSTHSYQAHDYTLLSVLASRARASIRA